MAHRQQKKKITIKTILLEEGQWWKFYQRHQPRIRPAIVENIVKLLSCGHTVRGYQTYTCSNPTCGHSKIVPHTCKCRACSSCGYRATTTWIDQQLATLPDTPWQHITFTLPDTLWPLFWLNRSLLNEIGKMAADIIQSIAKKKSLKVGIFLAIHTFGRNLKRNVHIHLSVTLGGITTDHAQWKSLYFHQQSLMKHWRYHIIAWLRRAANDDNFSLPQSLQSQPGRSNRFAILLDQLSTAYWHVYCQKPCKNHHQNVKYIGRYLRRPPIAQSKLMHYNGQDITFRYLDHYSKSYRTFRCSAEQFIARFISHIPDKYFRMVRYYGFLSHALRGKLLPIVNQLLGQNQPVKPSTTWPEQMVLDFGINPLECILCQSPMRLSQIHFGQSAEEIQQCHQQLALRQKIAD